ncbi:hypothetical protein BLNAU_10245 [Blattamonas nauphoetae]|uniref:Uncharacterized protein n=1 Tax=Blattamonas nauphoetae TaxID=2049346 RepID=A0ABQ9XTF4_9EUKA|nr:hypothetical protein BLNAU_10245 [Blattamonas nauphoetae]
MYYYPSKGNNEERFDNTLAGLVQQFGIEPSAFPKQQQFLIFYNIQDAYAYFLEFFPELALMFLHPNASLLDFAMKLRENSGSGHRVTNNTIQYIQDYHADE